MTGLDIFKQKIYFEVWDADLSRFVSEFYGRPWDFARAEESSNDTYKTFEVSKEGPDFFDDEEVESALLDWMNAPVPAQGDWRTLMDFEKFYPAAPIILFDLCRRGIIVEGEYLVHISW